MANFRGKVRKGLRDILADPTNGFNAKIGGLYGEYQIPPDWQGIELNWAPESEQVFEGYLIPDQALSVSQIGQRFGAFKAGVAIYTSQASNLNFVKYKRFSGEVIGHVDFYVMDRVGERLDVTDNVADAIEDAVNDCISRPQAVWPQGITTPVRYQCAREPIGLIGDGFLQRIPMQFLFEVNV